MKDPEIRATLKKWILEKNHGGLLIDELGVLNGESRIDLAYISDALIGYEIKSEHDTLERLPSQIKAYNKVFSQIVIVAATKHAKNIIGLVPNSWGILEARRDKITGDVRLVQIRRAKNNAEQNENALARLLWRDEALLALNNAGLDCGFRTKPRKVIFEHLAKSFSVSELQKLIFSALSERASWRPMKKSY